MFIWNSPLAIDLLLLFVSLWIHMNWHWRYSPKNTLWNSLIEMYTKPNKRKRCFAPCLVRPELSAQGCFGSSTWVQGKPVLVHGKKSTVRVIKHWGVALSELGEISISCNVVWDDICLFRFILFPRLLLSGRFLKPWLFPVELAVVQQKLRNQTGSDKGNRILVKGSLQEDGSTQRILEKENTGKSTCSDFC